MTSAKNYPSHKQQGMALLTILLLVVAITIVAGSMLASQKRMQRQYALTQNQDQMREYALTGEAWASQIIQHDSQVNQSDSLQDSWAKAIAPMTMDNATISLTIKDEASKFNLNNLYHDGKVDEQSLALFRRILVSEHINPAIANAVLDWQDPDSEPRPDGGAEADFYQSNGKPMPMPIANQAFLSVAELANVRGVEKSDFEKLKPLVTAVPYFLPLNINTAKPELLTALFASDNSAENNPASALSSGTSTIPTSGGATTSPNPTNVAISAAKIDSWAKARANNMALNEINELWALPTFAPVLTSQRQAVQGLLDTKSRAFSVMVKVELEGRELYLTSMLAKQNLTSHQAANPQPNQMQVVAFNRRILPFLVDND